jgi:myo-inositol catabolism protein IolC
MTLGFDRPLYFLPFDQRQSFQTEIFGWERALDAEQTGEVAAAKLVIYDAFQTAVAAGASKEHAAILVDEQFGAAILRDAARQGFMTACPAEKSGQEEFDFEYGEEYVRHIEAFNPTFCKALVRLDPQQEALNRRQEARLKQLSDDLHSRGRWFMIELRVVDPRPQLMAQAIEELQSAGVEPDVWKVQGLDRPEDCANIAATARRTGRDRVGCIIHGGGPDEQKVRALLAMAASVPGFVGFAVGRATFWDALVDWRARRITRGEAVVEIARRYREWIEIFEQAARPAAQAAFTDRALRRWENEGGHR